MVIEREGLIHDNSKPTDAGAGLNYSLYIVCVSDKYRWPRVACNGVSFAPWFSIVHQFSLCDVDSKPDLLAPWCDYTMPYIM
jgi:hypothetical protein